MSVQELSKLKFGPNQNDSFIIKDESASQHINNVNIHVTKEDKEHWNKSYTTPNQINTVISELGYITGYIQTDPIFSQNSGLFQLKSNLDQTVRDFGYIKSFDSINTSFQANSSLLVFDSDLSGKINQNLGITTESSNKLFLSKTGEWKQLKSGGIPIGTIFYFVSCDPPVGALSCNGQIISRCKTRYPQFFEWLINQINLGYVRKISNVEYDKDIQIYGQCGAFVVNGNDVRLPTIKYFLQGINQNSDIGKQKNDGLPNIEGNFGGVQSIPQKNKKSLRWQVNGAFSMDQENKWNGSISNTSWDSNRITFNAGRCSTIYGNSKNVQPRSISYNYCIQVYNEIIQLSMFNASQLDKCKLDVNLSNLQKQKTLNKQFPIDFVIKNIIGTVTWCRIWKSGWVEQGGYFVADGTNLSIVNFPVKMLNTYYTLLTSVKNTSSSIKIQDINPITRTLQSVTFSPVWVNASKSR